MWCNRRHSPNKIITNIPLLFCGTEIENNLDDEIGQVEHFKKRKL
jgi:hypothetical protein